MNSVLMRGAAGALLCAFVALGVCQVMAMHHAHPAGTDHFMYSLAVNKAWHGRDPYLPRHLGLGYLYPPPALLLLKAVEIIAPSGLGATAAFIILSLGAAVASFALLAGRLTPWRLYTGLLLLVSAGMAETLYVGQINALVVFLVALFIWAWRRNARLPACLALAGAVALKLTPLIFVLLFLTPRKWSWLVTLAITLAALEIAAELLIPSPHLATSFVATVRWALVQQAPPGGWNDSVSSNICAAAAYLLDAAPDPAHVHRVAQLVLGALLVLSYAQYLASEQSAVTTDALLVTASICMVLAPNIVWLHHMALLLPALWIVLVESHDRGLIAATLVALFGIQCARCASVAIGLPAAVPMAVAQLTLAGVAAAYAWRSYLGLPGNGSSGCRAMSTNTTMQRR